MALRPWDDELALGIASIDAQHRDLLDRVNLLHDRLGDPKAAGDLLEDLVDATMNHFIAEEDLLKRHGYADADGHTQAHSAYSSALVQHLDQLQAGTASFSQASVSALMDGLTRHIQADDQACVAFLKSKGEK